MRQEKQLKRSVCGDKCDEERNPKDVIRKYKWKRVYRRIHGAHC